jgi:putative Flp pilus-assembly TadE/G-like protein
MIQRASASGRGRGQMVVVFAGSVTAVILAVGLVIDGGYALAQRRASQNASDFAALAGARVLSAFVAGDTNNGKDANVKLAIVNTININNGNPVTFWTSADAACTSPGTTPSCDFPYYVRTSGVFAGWVGAGTIPTGSVGVKLTSSRAWRPFFLGLAGISNWSASATATAKGGYYAGGPGDDVFPAGIASSFFQTYPFCTTPGTISTNPADPCYPKNLTPGNTNVPGGFGWLKFGAEDKCENYGLGMDPSDGCDESANFLQGEIGPTTANPNAVANSYGCCAAVPYPSAIGSAPGLDKIGSLPGNKASADCSYYIDNKIVVTVPVWDTAGGSGANAWYHIVGYAGFEITACPGGKNLSGVWVKKVFTGPTTTTKTFDGQSLAVQLVQ